MWMTLFLEPYSRISDKDLISEVSLIGEILERNVISLSGEPVALQQKMDGSFRTLQAGTGSQGTIRKMMVLR